MFSEFSGSQGQERDPGFWELATPEQVKDFQGFVAESFKDLPGWIEVVKVTRFGDLAQCRLFASHTAAFDGKQLTLPRCSNGKTKLQQAP